MRVSLLPLDSRPCTYMFPVKLSALSGVEINVPPLEIMDNFKEPSDNSKIKDWVKQQASLCDTFVLSIEQFIYGGLIASRSMNISERECIERLELIRNLKKNYPNIEIHAFNVIMRTSISTLSAESKVWWHKINEYSHAIYLFENTGESQYYNKINRLTEEIPPYVLNEFLGARERNHVINMYCIRLLEEGIFSSLILLQEDSSPYGIHKREQKSLKDEIRDLKIEDRVFLHNGTDEAACEILARLISAVQKKRTSVYIQWLGGDKDNFIALYEDVPFQYNLESHLKSTGLVEVKDKKLADCILYIYLPKYKQSDACISNKDMQNGYSDSELETFAKVISEDIREKRAVALLDIAYANGGDGRFLSALTQKFNLLELCGYAAWNTASNSLGTLLAQISLSDCKNTKKNKLFTAERLFDDYIYQSIVRSRVEKKLEGLDQDCWDIADRSLAQKIISNEFELCHPVIAKIYSGDIPKYTAKLMWSRTFEIMIDIQNF